MTKKAYPPEYFVLHDAMRRCNNPKRPDYAYYGDRGIKVCDRWSQRGGWVFFLQDMGERPTPQHTIDRMDVNGDYKPSNCRWATRKEQALNRRLRSDYQRNELGRFAKA